MNKLAFVLMLVALPAMADVWYRVEMQGDEVVGLNQCEASGIHVLGPNEFPADAVLPKGVPLKYWKKSGQTFVEMSNGEKQQKDDAIKTKKAEIAAIKDELLRALCEVVADEFGMTTQQLEAKLKAKLK
jgi:hypothetical protein